MDKSSNILMPIIRAGTLNSGLSDVQKNIIDDKLVIELYKQAKKQDYAHLIYGVLKKESIAVLNENLKAELKRQYNLALYRYTMLTFEASRITEVLEKNGIKHMLLKGAILREYYPEPWTRMSCDVDVLLDESDADRASELLMKECSYTFDGKTSHDVALYSANKHVHIELHYKLIESNRITKIDNVLEKVWSSAILKENCAFTYEMPMEMFYFYHMAHMAKHFQDGGCGIKPIVDLWVIHNKMNYDSEKANTLLVEGGLFDFAEAMRKLCRVWLDGEEHDELSLRLETYIFDGGVYGNIENRVAVHQVKQGSKLKYALSKIFLKYEQLRFHYPVLNKHKWLFPFCQIRRWFKLLFRGGVKRSVRELEINKSITEEQNAQTIEMLIRLGLTKK